MRVEAGFGPCSVDGDELRVVSQEFHNAVRVMSAPCRVESQLNLADRILICLTHGLSKPRLAGYVESLATDRDSSP
jgi:hypothetical protein